MYHRTCGYANDTTNVLMMVQTHDLQHSIQYYLEKGKL